MAHSYFITQIPVAAENIISRSFSRDDPL